MPLTRRETLTLGLTAGGALLPNLALATKPAEIAFSEGKYVLPPLPGACD